MKPDEFLACASKVNDPLTAYKGASGRHGKFTNAAAPTTHGRHAGGAKALPATNSPSGSFWRGNRTAPKQGADADGLGGEGMTVPSNRRNAARPRRDVAIHSPSSGHRPGRATGGGLGSRPFSQ
jgi:hypothetical protein